MPPRLALAIGLAAVVLLSLVVFGWGIGSYPLYEPDEARHAEVSREMLEATTWHDWVVPRLDDAPYRNKPAPFYWLLCASFALFGVNEAAARLVSLVAGIVTALLVSAWASRRWGPRTGVLAGVVLVTAPEFALLGRFATLDMTLTLWTTLGVLAVHRFAERPGTSLVPAAVAGALGLLTKGLLAPGFIVLIGVGWLAMRGRLRLLTPRALVPAALAFLVIVLPWHVAAALLDPEYLRKLYIDQQWHRAVDARQRLHARPLLFYVPVLLGGFFPWSAFLPATIASTIWRRPRGADETFCALWAITVLVVLSLAEGKVPSYIVLAFPPVALLTARYLPRVLFGDAAERDATFLRAGCWAVVAALVIAPAVIVAVSIVSYGKALLATSFWSLILIPPALALAVLLRRGRVRDAVVFTGVANVVLLLVFMRFVAPPLTDIHSDAALARALRTAAPDHAGAPLVAYCLRSPSTSFYTGRPMLLRDRPAQLRALLAAHPLVFVVTSPQHVAELTAVGPFVPWYVGPRRLLFASQPPPASIDAGGGG